MPGNWTKNIEKQPKMPTLLTEKSIKVPSNGYFHRNVKRKQGKNVGNWENTLKTIDFEGSLSLNNQKRRQYQVQDFLAFLYNHNWKFIFNCVKDDYVTHWHECWRTKRWKNIEKYRKFRFYHENRDILAINDHFNGICFDWELQKRVPNWFEENHIFSTWQSAKYKMSLKNAWNISWTSMKIINHLWGKQSEYYHDIRPKQHVLRYTNFEAPWLKCRKIVDFWSEIFDRKWPHPAIKKLLIDG